MSPRLLLPLLAALLLPLPLRAATRAGFAEKDITPVRSGERDLVAEVARLQDELVSLLTLEPLAQAA